MSNIYDQFPKETHTDTTTPRTDAAAIENPNFVQVVNADFARQLEIELAEAKAEVTRLKVTQLQRYLESNDIESPMLKFKTLTDRAELAEGRSLVLWEAVKQEMELRKQAQTNLRRTIEIAEELKKALGYDIYDTELEAIKKTLPKNK